MIYNDYNKNIAQEEGLIESEELLETPDLMPMDRQDLIHSCYEYRPAMKSQMRKFIRARTRYRADHRFLDCMEIPAKIPYNTYQVKYATNNIFCHLYTSDGRTLHPAKCYGDYKISVSKKNKHKRIKELLELYSKEITAPKQIKRKLSRFMIFKIATSSRMRRRVVGWLNQFVVNKLIPRRQEQPEQKKYHKNKDHDEKTLPKQFIGFKHYPQKAFNGCRGKMVRRKKPLFPHYRKKFIR